MKWQDIAVIVAALLVVLTLLVPALLDKNNRTEIYENKVKQIEQTVELYKDF